MSQWKKWIQIMLIVVGSLIGFNLFLHDLFPEHYRTKDLMCDYEDANGDTITRECTWSDLHYLMHHNWNKLGDVNPTPTRSKSNGQAPTEVPER